MASVAVASGGTALARNRVLGLCGFRGFGVARLGFGSRVSDFGVQSLRCSRHGELDYSILLC